MVKPRRRLSTSFASSQQEMAEIHLWFAAVQGLLSLAGKRLPIADAQPNPDMGVQQDLLH